MEHCKYEERWGRVLTQLEAFSEKFCKHIEEGEKDGGYRDRLLTAEHDINALKKCYWKTAIVCGLIGGLIGQATPDLFILLIRALT